LLHTAQSNYEKPVFIPAKPTLWRHRLKVNTDGHGNSFTSIIIWASLGDWSLPEMVAGVVR